MKKKKFALFCNHLIFNIDTYKKFLYQVFRFSRLAATKSTLLRINL